MFYIVQAGDDFKIVTESGAIYTTLVMPAGVTVDATRRARFAVLNRKLVITNAPSKNVWVDPMTFTVYLLAMPAPTTAPTLAAGAAGALTGVYQYRYSFIQKSGATVVDESPLSAAGTVTVAAQKVSGSAIELSGLTQTTGRRFYRTASNGSVFFFAFDIDDNTTTVFTDDLPDAGLGTVAAVVDRVPAQGGSDGTSHMTLLTVWKNRLWGRSDVADLVDHIFYTNENEIYGWSDSNDFPAYPQGEDKTGITGFVPRRDALGITKQNRLLKIIGSSNDDFQVLIVVENIGNVAPDSIQVIRDAGYFLAADGVYRWDDEGVTCLSRALVDSWFTTSTVYNRSQFPLAVGAWNPRTNCYEICLAPTGGTDLTKWGAVELSTAQWFGPHFTDAFTPTARGLLRSEQAELKPAMGGADGYLYLQNQTGALDLEGDLTEHSIPADAILAWLMQGNPDLTHVWGRLSVLSRIEETGTLAVTAIVGRLNDPAQNPQIFDLTKGREIGARLGVGALCRLQLTQDAIGEQFLVYGLEITGIGVRGRR